MQFDDYDENVARSFAESHERAGGLAAFLQMRAAHSGPGELDVELDVRPDLLTPFGNMHGGVLSGLVDHALGTVCYPVIPRGAWAATTEFKVNLLAPVRDGVLRARSEVQAMTKSTAVVRIDVTNDGRLAGLAQGTVTIRPPKPKEPAGG